MNLCECGCGKECNNRFVMGHHRSFKGRTHSENTRQKLSDGKMDKNNPMYGRTSWNKGLKNSQIPWNKGLKGKQVAWNKGLKKHNYLNTPTYISWSAMNQRCNNPEAPNYKNYGAKEIFICKEWRNDFRNFLRDMGERPIGTEIHRMNSKDGYYKRNCIWVNKQAHGSYHGKQKVETP